MEVALFPAKFLPLIPTSCLAFISCRTESVVSLTRSRRLSTFYIFFYPLILKPSVLTSVVKPSISCIDFHGFNFMSIKMVGERLQVRIDHVAAALSKVYKSPVVDTILSLPQHQQVGYI